MRNQRKINITTNPLFLFFWFVLDLHFASEGNIHSDFEFGSLDCGAMHKLGELIVHIRGHSHIQQCIQL